MWNLLGRALFTIPNEEQYFFYLPVAQCKKKCSATIHACLQERRLVTSNVTISAVLNRPTHHGMGAYPRRCATTTLMLGLNNCGPSTDGDVRPAFHSLQGCTYSCIWFEAACVSVRWRHSHGFRFLCNGTSCLLSIVDRIELFCNQVVFR